MMHTKLLHIKPIFKLIKSIRFHLKKHDQFKIADDIRNVISVTHHFQVLSTKMTKYPDMELSKKINNYTNNLQHLINKYPAYPEFSSREQRHFVHDLLMVYYFIYFDMQNKCQTKVIHTTKTSTLKKKWELIKANLLKNDSLVLNTHLIKGSNETLIIKYLSETKVQNIFG